MYSVDVTPIIRIKEITALESQAERNKSFPDFSRPHRKPYTFLHQDF